MTLRIFCLLVISTLMFGFIAPSTTADKKAKVKIVHSDKLKQSKEIGDNVKLLIGNVQLKHENTIMFCDSAYFYGDSSYVEAFHDIHIIQNDSIHLYGDFLTYYGNTGIAKVRDNVRIEKKDILLTTEFLDFDRIRNVGYYFNKGKVVTGKNVLESIKGYYYPDRSEVVFKDSVVGTNPKYEILSDTLIYNTVSEISGILGPTYIVGDSNLIYSEDGYYDTKLDIGQLQLNGYIQTKGQILRGDTIYYDRNKGLGEVFSNMELEDTVNNMILKGDYGYYNELTEYAFATKRAEMLQVYSGDTLFMHADTLEAVPLPQDSSRLLKAYHGVKFFRKDMQGRCDSMVFDFRDSVNTFYQNPVIWVQGNQMTAQEIKLYSKNQVLNKAVLLNSAFIVAPEDSIHFNQIKGKDMTGYIRNNQIYKIDVDGNGQTVYYPKDNEYVIGVNRAESSNLTIELEGRSITGIKMRVDPKGNINPPYILPEEQVRLKGFMWLEDLRPKTRTDIFKELNMPENIQYENVYRDYKFSDIEENE